MASYLHSFSVFALVLWVFLISIFIYLIYFRWVSVWCDSFSVNFGELTVPGRLNYPRNSYNFDNFSSFNYIIIMQFWQIILTRKSAKKGGKIRKNIKILQLAIVTVTSLLFIASKFFEVKNVLKLFYYRPQKISRFDGIHDVSSDK